MSDKKTLWSQYKTPITLLVGIGIGSALGLASPAFGQKLKPLGDIFINLMFTIVVPLVFVSIAEAIGAMADMKRLSKIIGSAIGVFLFTSVIAGLCVMAWAHFFNPSAGPGVRITSASMGDLKTPQEILVSSLTVDDFPKLLSRSNMLPLIVFSMIFGFCVSVCGGKESPAGKLLSNLNDIIMKFIDIIMKTAPIGLGAYFASLVGEYGPQIIGDYGRSMAVYYPLCLVYALLFFPLYAFLSGGKGALKAMLKHIWTPAITAFATQSSAATLPVNKEACDKIGVPKDISDIVLPMGCTMHMDGSVLSSITKIVFLFGVFQIPFTGLGTYAMSMVVAILAAFVLSGAPGGGLVGEALIVSMFAFPPEAFPLIATLGFLFDPPATCLNATGDTIASMIVARMVEGKAWLDKKAKKA